MRAQRVFGGSSHSEARVEWGKRAASLVWGAKGARTVAPRLGLGRFGNRDVKCHVLEKVRKKWKWEIF
ncbi:hypothetical protein JTE90_028443 [Oedothorax gibbosus]|uniref:Uncharacterized protein n=1 Tax=Oedothorax gibbosus TaxID=931172 RepID=A0AAV6VHA1_9ARAC|nr:hypothetical protein JTE90_028443 [Oedothorax gibbosus]